MLRRRLPPLTPIYLCDETQLDTLNVDVVGLVRETTRRAPDALWLRSEAPPRGRSLH